MYELLKKIIYLFTKIKTYSLVGASGTGKSFRAKIVADKYGISTIIDDGLLIHDNKIIAGKSAKHEDNYFRAIQIAIFDEKEHRNEVIEALHKLKFRSILILGTSDKMISRICLALKLPQPKKTIKINEIASKEEIQKAIDSRKQGKHIIPVPSIEIERTAPEMLFNSINILLRRNKLRKHKVIEKTVVKPKFDDHKGAVTISHAALTQMIIHCINEYDTSIELDKVSVKMIKNQYAIKLKIKIPQNNSSPSTLNKLRLYIIKNIEKYTGININKVDIVIKEFSI